MKIAIVGKYNFHLECIPFILEIFKNDIINIYISIDNYKWLDYCKTIHNNINIFYNQFNNNIFKNNDKIFKLSSNDPCLDNEKIISILHLAELKSKSNKYISLTPYISGFNIFYTFPIFNPNINYCLEKTVTFIGYYLNKDFDEDTITFIKNNKDYKFNFIIYGENGIYSKIHGIQNISLFQKIPTLKLIEIINSSKYIMSKKYINFDRFSGQLGLAISFEKPLLIDTKSQQNYKLPGFSFQKNYTELGILNDVTDEQYNMKIKEIQQFKNEILEKNIKIFENF